MASNPDHLSKNFNAKEHSILHSLKTGYLQCDSPVERKKYVSTVIWVALCNHWRSVTGKQQIENPGGKAQVCLPDELAFSHILKRKNCSAWASLLRTIGDWEKVFHVSEIIFSSIILALSGIHTRTGLKKKSSTRYSRLNGTKHQWNGCQSWCPPSGMYGTNYPIQSGMMLRSKWRAGAGKDSHWRQKQSEL